MQDHIPLSKQTGPHWHVDQTATCPSKDDQSAPRSGPKPETLFRDGAGGGPGKKRALFIQAAAFLMARLRILMDHDARLVYRGVAGVLERKC